MWFQILYRMGGEGGYHRIEQHAEQARPHRREVSRLPSPSVLAQVSTGVQIIVDTCCEKSAELRTSAFVLRFVNDDRKTRSVGNAGGCGKRALHLPNHSCILRAFSSTLPAFSITDHGFCLFCRRAMQPVQPRMARRIVAFVTT